MTDKSLEEFLFKQSFHPMPFVRYTERPDICAAHLLKGILPLWWIRHLPLYLYRLHCSIIFSMLKNIGKHHLIGTFVRMIRFIGAVLSLVLLPFWYLLATKPNYLPDFLSYIGPNDSWGSTAYSSTFYG